MDFITEISEINKKYGFQMRLNLDDAGIPIYDEDYTETRKKLYGLLEETKVTSKQVVSLKNRLDSLFIHSNTQLIDCINKYKDYEFHKTRKKYKELEKSFSDNEEFLQRVYLSNIARNIKELLEVDRNKFSFTNVFSNSLFKSS